jgi:hypothetical protein
MKEPRKWNALRRAFALLLVLIGFFALITPFTPGSWLALIGLGILLDKSPAEVLDMIKQRLAKMRSRFKKHKD